MPPHKTPARGRKLREDEERLWHETMRDVRTLQGRLARAVLGKEPSRENTASSSIRLVPAGIKISQPIRTGFGTGVDGATARRMAQGRIAPDATLDLHGMTQDHAHAALERFLGVSVAHGRRCVLIVTGKGGLAKPQDDSDAPWARRRPGVLRSLVPLWLEHSAQRDRIASVRAAHIRHGGDGALYVYLRGK